MIKLDNLFVAMTIASRKKEKTYVFTLTDPDKVFEIYGTLVDTGDENGFDETKHALTTYFKLKVTTKV